MKDISSTSYRAYEKAYDTLNVKLFDGKLPAVVLTLRAGRNTHGYAWAKRFKLHDIESTLADVEQDELNAMAENEDNEGLEAIEQATFELFDEIAINPATASRPPRDVLGTLLHEMCHVWQFNFGKPSRNGYHNAQWAGKMLEVGLHPFNAKNPDVMVGQGVTHTIEVDGIADKLFAEIEADFGADLVVELPFLDAKKKPAKNSKVKFTCPICGANAWGKNSLHVICADDDEVMLSANDEGEEI